MKWLYHLDDTLLTFLFLGSCLFLLLVWIAYKVYNEKLKKSKNSRKSKRKKRGISKRSKGPKEL